LDTIKCPKSKHVDTKLPCRASLHTNNTHPSTNFHLHSSHYGSHVAVQEALLEAVFCSSVRAQTFPQPTSCSSITIVEQSHHACCAAFMIPNNRRPPPRDAAFLVPYACILKMAIRQRQVKISSSGIACDIRRIGFRPCVRSCTVLLWSAECWVLIT
jgi:hypothetical protein